VLLQATVQGSRVTAISSFDDEKLGCSVLNSLPSSSVILAILSLMFRRLLNLEGLSLLLSSD
jgi:hypothetical protein